MINEKESKSKKWTKKEKEKLVNLYLTCGNCWTKISKKFKGRSPLSVRRAYERMDIRRFAGRI